jgi:hypothetical protein
VQFGAQRSLNMRRMLFPPLAELPERKGWARRTRSALVVGWAIIGWYMCTLRDAVIHLSYEDWLHFYDPKVWQPVIVPGQAGGIVLPTWLAVFVTVVSLCGVLGCAWAAIDVGREARAKSRKQGNPTTWCSDVVMVLRSRIQRQQQGFQS